MVSALLWLICSLFFCPHCCLADIFSCSNWRYSIVLLWAIQQSWRQWQVTYRFEVKPLNCYILQHACVLRWFENVLAVIKCHDIVWSQRVRLKTGNLFKSSSHARSDHRDKHRLSDYHQGYRLTNAFSKLNALICTHLSSSWGSIS